MKIPTLTSLPLMIVGAFGVGCGEATESTATFEFSQARKVLNLQAGDELTVVTEVP